MESKYAPPPVTPPQQPALDTIKIGSEGSFTILSWHTNYYEPNTKDREELFIKLWKEKQPSMIALPAFHALTKEFREDLLKTMGEQKKYAALPNSDPLTKATTTIMFYNTGVFTTGKVSGTYHKNQRTIKMEDFVAFGTLKEESQWENIYKFETTIQEEPFTLRVLNLLNRSHEPLDSNHIGAARYFLNDQNTSTNSHHVAIAIGGFPPDNAPVPAFVESRVLCTHRPLQEAKKAGNALLNKVKKVGSAFLKKANKGDNALLKIESDRATFSLEAGQLVVTKTSASSDQPAVTTPSPTRLAQPDVGPSPTLATSQSPADPSHSSSQHHRATEVTAPETSLLSSTIGLNQPTMAVTETKSEPPIPSPTRSTRLKGTKTKISQTDPDTLSVAPPRTESAPTKSSPPNTTSKSQLGGLGFFAVGATGLTCILVGAASAKAAAQPHTASTILTRLPLAWAITVATAGLGIGLAAIAFAILAHSFKHDTQQTVAPLSATQPGSSKKSDSSI